ncbi:MAG: hypothetical protein GF320_00780 [Armatimonadia bacterium]|nr:hypothetical protein [Armatimonadia bacterium]
MKRKVLLVAALSAILVLGVFVIAAQANNRGGNSGRVFGTVLVTGQGELYQTFATADLPPNGPFQVLYTGNTASGYAETEYGPGDPGYVGGRWIEVYIRADGSHMYTENYFLCPLLGPGVPMS